MEYEMVGKSGKIKRYEVSYSQILQQRANKLLTALIILILVVLLVIGYVLLKLDAMDIFTRLIYK